MTTPASGPYWSPTPPIGDQPPTGPAVDSSPPALPPKRRRWPWVVGIVVALVAGTHLGTGNEGENTTALAAAERQLADLQLSLDATQDQLAKVSDERDAALEDLEIASSERDAALEDLTAAETDRDDAIARAEDAEAALAATEGARAAAEGAQGAGADAEPAAQFGDGVWIVGEDIEAGVYRNDGGSLCYWERLSGLSGEFGDIIANDLPEGQAVVEIASSDTAFSSQGCGTWPRQ